MGRAGDSLLALARRGLLHSWPRERANVATFTCRWRASHGLRRELQKRQLVGGPDGHAARAVCISRLCDVGLVSRGSLHGGPVPQPVLLADVVSSTERRRGCPRMVRGVARLVASGDTCFAGAIDP